MSLSFHIDNKGKDNLILGKRPAQGLDYTKLTLEAKYPINFTQSGKRFVLSLHHNRRNSFIFVNATKVYQLKAWNSEIKDYALCLGNFPKYFTINNIKKTRLIGVAKPFLVDFNPIDANNILDIHKCLMKKTWYKHYIKSLG